VDVHLMIERPERHVQAFADAGADGITLHVEATPHVHRAVQRIRELGVRAGVALNPATPIEMARDVLPYVDLVLVMSVNPGFGGQSYIPTSTRKIAAMRELIEREGFAGAIELQVDGGVAPDTIAEVLAAGATCVVAGSAVYNRAAPVAENLAALRAAAGVAP
jgi:ribulose-phosphate 3-epimerase